MSVSALHIYEQLTDAPDDKTRARIIAEAIGQLEDRYPQLREVATQPQLRETELRLQKEIQLTRLEIKEVEANLQKEIQQTRLEIKEVEANLQKDIQQTRLEIKEVEANLQKDIQQMRLEIKEVEANLQKEIKEVEARLSKEIHLLDLKIAENTTKIAETKAELVRWVVGVGLLQTTLLTGVLLRVAHLI